MSELTALESFASAAADRLGPDTHCSILLRSHGHLTPAGSSNTRAHRCDAVEAEAAEGPCVVAMYEMRGVLVPDIRADERWSAWRETALEVGFISSAALPAYVDEHTTVALNLYSEDVDPWDAERLVSMDQYVQEIAEAVRTRLGS